MILDFTVRPMLSRCALSTALMMVSAMTCVPASAQQAASADTLIADAHYLRARPVVQAMLQKNPKDIHALVQRSVLEWAFHRLDDAIATAEKAVGMDDRSAEAHTQLTNALGAKLASTSAGTFERMTLARRFRKEADLSVQLDPKSLDALEDSARYYWNAPGFVGGDRSRAQQLAERVASIDPARGAALKAGFLAEEKDKAKRAATIEGLWRGVVAARPESADAHAGLSAAYFEEGPSKFPLADSEARRAIALTPSHIAAYRQLAVLYATTGRWEELDKLLKQARTAVPDNLSPDYHAARIIIASNAADQLARAEQYLRAYLAQPAEGEEPSHAAAHWRLGLVLEKEGRRSDAIQELQTAVHEDGSLEGAKQDLKRLS
jgi:tetratricopeptide (TPR) repeat protein